MRTLASRALYLTVSAFILSFNSLDARAQETVVAAIETVNGHYLTAVNGGGLGGPDDGPGIVALHTDATAMGPWEVFTIVWLDASHIHFALRTSDGDFLTAMNGGGIGGPNDNSSPIHTDAVSIGPWEEWRVNFLPNNKVTISVPTGNFLTAVDGGGVNGAPGSPIETSFLTITPWQTFTLVRLNSN